MDTLSGVKTALCSPRVGLGPAGTEPRRRGHAARHRLGSPIPAATLCLGHIGCQRLPGHGGLPRRQPCAASAAPPSPRWTSGGLERVTRPPPGPQRAGAKPTSEPVPRLTLGPRPSPTPCSPRCPTQGLRRRPGRRRAHAGQSSHGSSPLLSLTGRPGLALALQAQTPSRGRTLITAVATGYRLLDDGHTSSQRGARPTVSPQRMALCLSVSLTGPPGCSVTVLGCLSRCQGHSADTGEWLGVYTRI